MAKNLLMDVDGVLTDFLQHSLRWHGRADMAGSYPRGEWETPKVLGLSDREFWKKIDFFEFWSTIPTYPGSADFLAAVKAMCDNDGVKLSFCTSSSLQLQVFVPARIRVLDALCREAKIAEQPPLYIAYRGSKGVFGRRESLLVDDYPKNIRSFVEAGGCASLVPMPWNTKEGSEPEGCRISMDGPDYTWVINEIANWLNSVR